MKILLPCGVDVDDEEVPKTRLSTFSIMLSEVSTFLLAAFTKSRDDLKHGFNKDLYIYFCRYSIVCVNNIIEYKILKH